MSNAGDRTPQRRGGWTNQPESWMHRESKSIEVSNKSLMGDFMRAEEPGKYTGDVPDRHTYMDCRPIDGLQLSHAETRNTSTASIPPFRAGCHPLVMSSMQYITNSISIVVIHSCTRLRSRRSPALCAYSTISTCSKVQLQQMQLQQTMKQMKRRERSHLLRVAHVNLR